MRYFFFCLMFVILISSCTVEYPINGPKNVHFSVVSLPDSTPIDSIPCALIQIHSFAFTVVTDSFTNENGFCSLAFDFTYDKYIFYSAELFEIDEPGIVYQGLSKTKGYYRVQKKSEIIDVSRKSDFVIKKVIEPLGILHLSLRYKNENFDILKLKIYEENVMTYSQQISKNYLLDSMNYYCSALKPIRIDYSIYKNNEIISTGSDTCRLEQFTIKSKVLVLR